MDSAPPCCQARYKERADQVDIGSMAFSVRFGYIPLLVSLLHFPSGMVHEPQNRELIVSTRTALRTHLHDAKRRIIDVQLHALKQALKRLQRRFVAIQQVLADVAHADLSSHSDLRDVFKPHGRFRTIGVVKDNRDTCSSHTCLTAFIDQIHQVVRTDRRHLSDTKHETDGVEDVGFTGAVETRDGVEGRVPSCDRCSDGIRLEAVEDEFRDAHRGREGAAGSH